MLPKVLFLLLAQAAIDHVGSPPNNSLQHQLDMVPIEKDDRLYQKILIAAVLAHIVDENLRTAAITCFVGIGVAVRTHKPLGVLIPRSRADQGKHKALKTFVRQGFPFQFRNHMPFRLSSR